MKHISIVTELQVIARSPFELHFEGTADTVSATNKVGNFDILPGHADFFSLLEAGEVIITKDKQSETIDIKNGIITVRNNNVMLFVNM